MLLYVGGNFNAKGGGLSNPQLQDGSLPDRDSICVAVDDHGRQLVGFCEQKCLVLCTGRAPGAVTEQRCEPGTNAARLAAWTIFSPPGGPFTIFGAALCPRAAPVAMIRIMNLSRSFEITLCAEHVQSLPGASTHRQAPQGPSQR